MSMWSPWQIFFILYHLSVCNTKTNLDSTVEGVTFPYAWGYRKSSVTFSLAQYSTTLTHATVITGSVPVHPLVSQYMLSYILHSVEGVHPLCVLENWGISKCYTIHVFRIGKKFK